jgi:YgiT-type zinc finger domain-containing protein
MLSKKSEDSMTQCDICGQEGITLRYISRSYGKGDNLLVIENIPILTCPHCGESYLTAQTLHKINNIKKHRQTLAVQKTVEVASLV